MTRDQLVLILAGAALTLVYVGALWLVQGAS